MNDCRTNLMIGMQLCSVILLTSFIAGLTQAQTAASGARYNQPRATQAPALMPRFRLSFARAGLPLMQETSIRKDARSRSNTLNLTPMAAGPNFQVLGSGTLGRLAKWTGLTNTNSFIGDTSIFEDKFGNVGIGTDSPTSKLTVNGTIQASGGSSVLHNDTLFGNGTTATPLGVAVPLFLRGGAGAAGAVIAASNTEEGGIAILGLGGFGGAGVSAAGGRSDGTGGAGLEAIGGGGGGDLTSKGGPGVRALGGTSTNGAGAPGVFGTGGFGGAVTGTGVIGQGGDSETGVGGDGIQGFAGRGHAPGFEGAAGSFFGDVVVTDNLGVEGDLTAHGNLTAFGVKQFKIDHPLDPENRYLYHAAIESSEVLNIYSGNVVTNQDGEAVVLLPDWFEAINRDFRYQLTVVGTFAQAIVADEIQNNRFKIRTNAPGVRVSWQVTGVRSDAAIRQHPFKAEEDKPERERGTYLIPEAYGQPEDRGVEWALHPRVMLQIRETQARRKDN
jgi:hypothetical protein